MPDENNNAVTRQLKQIADTLLEKTPCCNPELSSNQNIIPQIRKHGVLPLFHHVISRQSCWFLFDDDVKHKISQLALGHMANDMVIEHELITVLQLFAENNISFLILKGTALAYTDYEKSHHRDRCDTDLIFEDSEHADLAANLLEAHGYTRSTTLTGDFVGYQFTCQRHIKNNLPMTFDMHLKISDHVFYAHLFSYSELFRNRRRLHKLPVDTEAYGLNPVYALIHACIHLTGHLGRANLRLIWLYDIYLLSNQLQQQDWKELTDICIDKSIAGSLLDGLGRTKEFFPLSIPDEYFNKLTLHAKTEEHKPQGKTSRWQHYYISLQSIPSLRGKARMIREHLLPRPAYIMHKYQTSNHWLLPYLYIHRIVTGFKKYL